MFINEDIPMDIVYNGKHFPEYDYKGSLATVAVTCKCETEYLYLPCSIQDINHALTKLCDELRYTLNSRTDFEYIRKMLHSKTEIPDIRRAAYFYQIIRESYASGLDSFGAQPHNMWNNFPLIEAASARLRNVVIENKDFEKLIKQYDRPNTLFYLDPPYFETEDYYEDVGFTEKDHVRLRDALMGISAKLPDIKKICDENGGKVVFDIVSFFDGNSKPALYFERNFLDIVNYLNATIQIDLYVR
ncbi:MAG: DNA adenine methylase [Ruminococcus sp.]|nr:DNA adenine methylase [Candidatus Apopatosoma intestinale]